MNRTHLLLAAATSFLATSGLSRADTVSALASANATVQTGGPRSGTSGTNFFNVEGVSGFQSFGVLDFSASSFNLSFPVTEVTSLTLSLTESNTAFTTASGALAFYLVTDTTTGIAAGSSPLTFQSGSTPVGLGTQLGASPFLLGTGNFSTNSGNTGSGTVDSYTFSLASDAQTYFLSQLNSSTGTLRLVVVPTDTTGSSTWAGATNSAAATRPALTLNATLDQPALTWIGGSGTWNGSGGTDWSGGAWDPTKTATFSTGSGVVTLGTPVTALGATFNTGGYTIAGAGANKLTLSSSAGGNTITVANAVDTATISAEIAGTSGLTKGGSGTLVLSGANSFTGNVTINNGALAIGADTNLGDAANGIVLNTGTLKSTSAFTVGAARTLSGSGVIDASAGALVFSGPINATSLVLAANSNVTFSGASAAFGSAALGTGSRLVVSAPVSSATRTTFSGDGTVELNGDNSGYANGFTMSKGSGSVGPTVVLSSATALGGAAAQSLFFNAGELHATTALTGANAMQTGISVGGSVAFSGSDMEFTGAFGFFGTVARTLTVTNHTTISSTITSAGNAQDILIKAGAGTLTLAAPNSYGSGTQVLAGTLEVSPSGTLGLGNVTVAAGAVLKLENNLSVDDFSDLFLLSGGSSFGMIDLDFDGSLSETVNSLTINGVLMPAGVYNASNFPDYFTGDGNLLVAVPEPHTPLLLLFGAAGMFLLGRSRQGRSKTAAR
jgi:autotransporter-associated beta strand protein